MAKTDINFKQLARTVDVPYSVIMNWRKSRYALIDYLITSDKYQGVIESLESDNAKLKAKINQINKFTSGV